MSDAVSQTLSWFANYSNFYSVLSVIVGFCVMVVFILRLNGDHFMTSATHYNVVQEQKMMLLTNPFTAQLNPKASSSLADGASLKLSATSRTKMRIFWGVKIEAFQKELQKTVDDITERYTSEEIFDKDFYCANDYEILSSDSPELELQLNRPSSLTEEVLGEPPRKIYPLVVVMVLDDSDISLQYTAIVVQFMVIHLKDRLCSLDSHIVYQFVKTNHNKLISLQPIFSSSLGNSSAGASQQNGTTRSDTGVSTESQGNSVQEESRVTDNSDGVAGADDDFDLEEACCVCQNAAIFYTLLPCRHACVCSSCIKQLERCPMCRGYIDSFFRLDNRSENLEESENLESESTPLTRWQAFNHRLNEMFGLE